MSSLDDILNRVLSQAADSAATKIQTAVIARRPLRDVDGSTSMASPGMFQDLRAAMQTIHDPGIAQGLRNTVVKADASEVGNGVDVDGNGVEDSQESSSSPAVRRTTLADDLGALSTITEAGTDVAKNLTVAGKAAQGLAGSAGKLDEAVVSLARSVTRATPGTPAAQASGNAGGILGRVSGFMESDSIAQAVRAMVGRIRNGSDSSSAGGSGIGAGGNGSGDSGASFGDRFSAGFDRALARAVVFFRSMSAGSGGGARGGNGGNSGDGSDDGADGSSPLSGRSLRTIVSQRIGRAGRRMLTGAFRGRVSRGMRMLRGRGAAGGGGGGGGWAGRIGGMPPGGMIGGGIHHGGMAGGGPPVPPGGAPAGGGMAGGFGLAAVIGLVVSFVALIAIVNTAAQAIYKLGMQGYETALRVSQYNGELNIAKAQLNVGRLMRDIQTAQDLSKSGAGMMKAIDKLEEVLRPITTEALSISMDLLTTAIEALTATIKSLTSLGKDTMKFMDEIAAALTNRPVNPAFQGNQGQNQQPQVQPDFLGLHAEFAARAVPLRPRAPIPPQGAARP